MRERLLNGLLVVQVVLSLALTGFIISRPDPARLQAERPLLRAAAARPPQPTPDLFMPRLIWMHPESGPYAGLHPGTPDFDLAWAELRDVAARTLANGRAFRRATRQELVEAGGQPLVGVDLPLELPPGQWARVLGLPGAPVAGRVGVDRLVFSLGAPARVFALGDTVSLRVQELPEWDRQRLLRLLSATDLTGKPAYQPVASIAQAARALYPTARAHGHAVGARMGDPLAADQGIPIDPWVLAPVDPVVVPALTFQPEVPRAAALVPLIFPDVTVVREVREQDGAVTHTDNKRALQIHPDGAIQFWDLSEPAVQAVEPAPDLEEALRLADAFISRNGLWPTGTTLKGYHRGGNTTTLQFQQWADWPFLSRQPVLVVQVGRGRVTYLYRGPDLRAAVVEGAATALVDVATVLDFVTQTVSQRPDRLRAIWPAHRARRGHYDSPVPIWAVRLSNGRELLVDGQTGRFVW